MKRVIQNIFLIVMISGTAWSCKKMDFNYRQFVDGGEIIYIAKADSIKLRGGNNRLELSWLLLSDPKVHEYKVYWNNRKDSIKNLIQKTTEIDTVRVMLKNLAEGAIEFEIFMYDKLGNSSVKASKIGQVYGERYRSSLLNRTYMSTRRLVNKDLEFDWKSADNDVLFSEIKYTDNANKSIVKIVKNTAKLDTLKSFPIKGTMDLRTAFLPDTSAIDTFYTSYQTIVLPM